MDDVNKLDIRSFKEMQRTYKNLPYGTRRLAATLDTLAMVEPLGPSCRISVLYDLVWAYAMGDDPAKALPACAEFFALLDQYPEAINGRVTAPSIAMIAANVARSLPQIPLEQCQTLLEQFHQQVKKYGVGERLWQIHACSFSLMLRDMQEAERRLRAFYATPRDSISDCKACEASNAAECLLDLEHREEARAALRPVLDGLPTCGG